MIDRSETSTQKIGLGLNPEKKNIFYNIFLSFFIVDFSGEFRKIITN